MIVGAEVPYVTVGDDAVIVSGAGVTSNETGSEVEPLKLLSPLYTAVILEYVPTLGFQVVHVATPAVTVCESQPVMEVEPFLKLTVPVAVFELMVAVSVLAAP